MKNPLKISSGHLFSEIVRITLLNFNFFLTVGIFFFQIRNLMLSLNLKLCLAVSRGGMVYEKPFKDILWSLIFRNCPNYVTKLQFFLTVGIFFFQIRNLMLSLNLKLCLAVSRGGMVYEKPFKDILWSLIFRNCPNYVTKLQFFSDGWNLFFSNQEFNALIEPEVVSCS